MRPEHLGFDSRRLGHLTALTHRYVDEGKLPGAVVAVVRGNDEVIRDAYGLADIERGTPVAEDTIFRIFSMTKPITSIGLLQLVERGLVLLEDPVAEYIPEFADGEVWVGGDAGGWDTRPVDRPMEIVDLLRHTAGLGYGFLDAHPIDALYTAAGVGTLGPETRSLAEVTRIVAGLPLAYSPGDHWSYSMATDVCGRVIEVVAGTTLGEHLRAEVTEPLGMPDTGFSVGPPQYDRLAANYLAAPDGGLVLVDDPATSPLREPPAFEAGGGGMVGTLDDYLRFCRCLLRGGELDGERVIGRKTLDYAMRNHLPGGRTVAEMWLAETFPAAQMTGMGFGLGFSVVVDAVANRVVTGDHETAWGGAASTCFWIDPEENLAVVFMTQQMPSRQYPIRRQLRNVVYGALA